MNTEARAGLGRVAAHELLAIASSGGAAVPGAVLATVSGAPLRTLTATAAKTVDNVLVDLTCDTQGDLDNHRSRFEGLPLPSTRRFSR